VIQGIVKYLMAQTQSPCPDFARPHNDSRVDSFVYVHYLDVAFILLKPVAHPTVHARRPSAL